MEEKYKQFKEYDWVESKEWQSYYTNIYPTPPPQKILRYKKKFYRNKIDPDFDIDYKPPNEEESNTYSSSSYSPNTNSNTNTNANQSNQEYTTEQAFETYKAAQTLANPIQSFPLQLIETFFLLLFLFSLPLRYKSVLIGFIAFLIRTIRLIGIPKFSINYLQAFIMNDSCHILLYTIQTVTDRINYYMLLPVTVSVIIALCENIKSMNLPVGGIIKYVDLINNKKEEIIQSRSHIELAIGFISIVGIFLKINTILTPIIYWQLIRVRYTLNPYVRKSFSDFNKLADQIKNSNKCPGPLKFVIDKGQWAFSLMGKLSPQERQAQGQGQQNNNQGAGSFCTIF